MRHLGGTNRLVGYVMAQEAQKKGKALVNELEQRVGKRQKMTLPMSSNKLVAAVLIVVLAWVAIMLLDWSRMVAYVNLRQDPLLKQASDQAWIFLVWLAVVGWWYTYLLRRATGWSSWKARLYWLTPLLAGAFYAGILWADARFVLFGNEAGRQALGATIGLGWPLLILVVAGLEWNSRRT